MIQYREATKSDLNQIVTTHTECFQKYFLTSMGKEFLKRYYEAYLDEKAPFVVAVDDNGDIVGFCMGYYSGSKARINFERENKWFIIRRLLVACLKFNKGAYQRIGRKIKQLFKKGKKAKSDIRQNHEKREELLSICVLDKARGQSVATKLLESFENIIMSDGATKYNLSVYKTNHRAIRFYEKSDFKYVMDLDDEKIYTKQLSAIEN